MYTVSEYPKNLATSGDVTLFLHQNYKAMQISKTIVIFMEILIEKIIDIYNCKNWRNIYGYESNIYSVL